MKKKVGLVALVVVGGLVGAAALLMWGPFSSTPEASATWVDVDLVAGRTEIDVGDVAVVGLADGLHVTFTADPGQMIDEVHVCISEGDTCSEEPAWTPPGQCPWSADPPGVQSSIEVVIPWADIGGSAGVCGQNLWIQAHAATASGQTAYGDNFKGSYCRQIGCCIP